MGKQNRIIAFNDYSEDANGQTSYLISAKHYFDEGGDWTTIESTENIVEAEFFSKKQALKAKQILIADGYKDAVEIRLQQESNCYSIKPTISIPGFISEDFGFQMVVNSQVLKMGNKVEYTHAGTMLNFETLDSRYYPTYYFKTREDAEIFRDNNLENGYNRLLKDFKMLKY